MRKYQARLTSHHRRQRVHVRLVRRVPSNRVLPTGESDRETLRVFRVRPRQRRRNREVLRNVRVVRVVLPKRESLHRGNRSNARTDWTHAAADWVFFGRVFALQEQVPDATDGDRARIYVRVREEVLFRDVSDGIKIRRRREGSSRSSRKKKRFVL